MKKTEYFPIVTPEGKVVGKASREECHSGTFLLHPVVHLHIIDKTSNIYLQKRSSNKDIQPNKWDTSVGGHVDFGEEIEHALRREAYEELGVEEFTPRFIKRYQFTSTQESELVHVFKTIYSGEITIDRDEISEGRFWTIDEIKDHLGKDIFTPNFEQEFLNIVLPDLQQ